MSSSQPAENRKEIPSDSPPAPESSFPAVFLQYMNDPDYNNTPLQSNIPTPTFHLLLSKGPVSYRGRGAFRSYNNNNGSRGGGSSGHRRYDDLNDSQDRRYSDRKRRNDDRDDYYYGRDNGRGYSHDNNGSSYTSERSEVQRERNSRRGGGESKSRYRKG